PGTRLAALEKLCNPTGGIHDNRTHTVTNPLGTDTHTRVAPKRIPRDDCLHTVILNSRVGEQCILFEKIFNAITVGSSHGKQLRRPSVVQLPFPRKRLTVVAGSKACCYAIAIVV